MPRPDGVLLINRKSLSAVTLAPGLDDHIRAVIHDAPPTPPAWLDHALQAVDWEPARGRQWHENFVMRESTHHDFRRVAWEITERCNLRCSHCYLGKRTRSGLSLEVRKMLLNKIERLGCLWLQLTGGEALADPLFEQTYRAAWNQGLMVSITTNGTRLLHHLELLKTLPPRRITISLYGASNASYKALTGAPPGTYQNVIDGLKAAKSVGIRLRVSIIATQTNAHEIVAMEKLLDELSIEYHTYSKLIPTVQGGKRPLEIEVEHQCDSGDWTKAYGCAGGTKALHMHVSGRVGPCKLLPNISVDLLREDASALKPLTAHSGMRPTTPECKSCLSASRCTTCAPIFALYKNVGIIPGRVCDRHNTN